uniref:Uncharacterized protein n=1 Tax=Arundo donax TaxID=35708 RepID=A0A0A9EWP2_ARUDO
MSTTCRRTSGSKSSSYHGSWRASTPPSAGWRKCRRKS